MDAFYLLLLSSIVCGVLSQDITPDSAMGDCFRQNALKMVGSKCFAKRHNTFGRQGREKKAAFIKYITDKCQVTVPFEYADSFSAAVTKLESNSGDWVEVTGVAKIGDLVVDDKRLMFVTDTGRRTNKFYLGKKIRSKTEPDLWYMINENTPDDWETFPQFSDSSKIVNPSAPDGECAPYTWQQEQTDTRKRLYWRVARNNERVVRLANDYDATRKTTVYRYIGDAGASPTSPPTADLLAMILQPAAADSSSDTPNTVDTTIQFTPQFDLGNMYNTETDALTMAAGVYFGGLYACLPALQSNTVNMRGGTDDIGIEYGPVTHTMNKYYGRNFLMKFAQDTSLDVTYQGLMCSQNTFLFMIPLEEFIFPLMAFSVAADSTGPLSLNHVIYNEQAVWGNNRFTTPYVGPYYFALSGATPFSTGQIINLMVNGETAMTQQHTGRPPSATISFSTGCLLNLETDDVVTLTSVYEVASDAENLQTSLAGFLYAPVGGMVAWSVSATSDFIFPPFELPNPAIPFDSVDVHYGFVWDATEYKVTIPATGYYFLQLQVTVLNGYLIDMCINNANSSPDYVAQLPRVVRPDGSLISGDSTFSSSNVVYLLQGDELWAENKVSELSYGYMGSNTRQTTFTGMLINAE